MVIIIRGTLKLNPGNDRGWLCSSMQAEYEIPSSFSMLWWHNPSTSRAILIWQLSVVTTSQWYGWTNARATCPCTIRNMYRMCLPGVEGCRWSRSWLHSVFRPWWCLPNTNSRYITDRRWSGNIPVTKIKGNRSPATRRAGSTEGISRKRVICAKQQEEIDHDNKSRLLKLESETFKEFIMRPVLN